MSLKVVTAATETGLTRLVNGLVIGKTNLVRGPDQSPNPAVGPHNLYKHPVDGLDLHFISPISIVTFVGNLDFKEIVSQINVQVGLDVAHLLKVSGTGDMVLAFWNDTTPVSLDVVGTANAYLGFSTTTISTQSPIDPLSIKSIKVSAIGSKWVCCYDTVIDASINRITEDGIHRVTELGDFRILE